MRKKILKKWFKFFRPLYCMGWIASSVTSKVVHFSNGERSLRHRMHRSVTSKAVHFSNNSPCKNHDLREVPCHQKPSISQTTGDKIFTRNGDVP